MNIVSGIKSTAIKIAVPEKYISLQTLALIQKKIVLTDPNKNTNTKKNLLGI